MPGVNRFLASLGLAVSLLPGISDAQGFPNVQRTAGELLSGLNAPQQGRTAIIAWHNGVLFTVPEIPSSQPGADFFVRTWNLADPTAPVQTANYGVTPMPINAHGYFKSGDYLVLGSNWPPETPWSFRALGPGSLERTAFPDLYCAGVRGCLFQPWLVGDTYWSYGDVGGDAFVELNYQRLAEWDHLGQTGVIGHPFLLGDRLYFVSDQSRTGIAAYRLADGTTPVLADVLTDGGPGGYWPELWAGDGRLYAVMPYQENGNGVRIADITDPNDLRFVRDIALPGAEAMYAQFQDEFAFIGDHKIDMRTLTSVLFLDGENRPRTNDGGIGVNTSQFALPLGNLLVTGGIGPNEGMAIWAHQDAPDTRGPTVGFHVPEAGRTNYPVGAPISLIIHETLETPTLVNGVSFIVRPLGGDPIDGRITFAFDDVLTFTPDQPLQPDSTYEVVLPAGGITDAAGNGMDAFSFTFSTGGAIGGNAAPVVSALDVSSYPVSPGASVTLTAVASDPENDSLEYRFDVGDGSDKTPWSGSASLPAVYSAPGHYRASVQVRDPAGAIATRSATVTVLTPPAGVPPTQSAPLLCDADTRRVIAINPDNDSLRFVTADTLETAGEIAVCDDPRSVARAGDQLWVACRDDDTVAVLDAASGNLVESLAAGYGAAPVSVVATPDGGTVFVAMDGAGEVRRYSAATRALTGTLALGPTPRAMAVTGDGGRLLVARFLSRRNHGEVWDIDTASFTLTRTILLPKFGNIENMDGTAAGRGTPNYLRSIAISPDGARAWIAANKPNVERGVLTGADLDQDNTVRNVLLQLDLATNTMLGGIDLDNSDSASAVSYSPLGDYLFVALQGDDEVAVFDALAFDSIAGMGSLVTSTAVGAAPQGICVDGPSNRTFVKNLMSRDLTALETDALFRQGAISLAGTAVATVGTESLPADVLAGKRIFYNSDDARMSPEGYISCASCHLDGGHDGRTWDFSGRGEGLRNTTTLRGRAGLAHGNVHWTANFDEIQDFEGDIRSFFGGEGFLTTADWNASSDPLGAPKAGRSAELDALAAYVSSLGGASLPRSPHRDSDGAFTAEALAGAAHFASLGCDGCHSGDQYTDSTLGAATLHDVGTLRTTSGGRLGGPLTGIDTPTLHGVWRTAPYFHDGSAETLSDVFAVTGGSVLQAEAGVLAGGAGVLDESYVRYNADDTARGLSYVDISTGGARITYNNVDGGSGGTGAVELRYSSGYGVHQVEVRVNGISSGPISLPLPGNEPEWRHTNWARVRAENLSFTAGNTNTVQVRALGSFPNISIDEIVISRPDELTSAQPHRVALSLSESQRAELEAFLLQLDGAFDDADDDGVDDASDNCLGLANADQRDTNGDGIGNACDADLDNNCNVDFADLALLKAAFFSTDGNADFDGDGTVNFVDLQLMKASFFGPPGPTASGACGS